MVAPELPSPLMNDAETSSRKLRFAHSGGRGRRGGRAGPVGRGRAGLASSPVTRGTIAEAPPGPQQQYPTSAVVPAGCGGPAAAPGLRSLLDQPDGALDLVDRRLGDLVGDSLVRVEHPHHELLRRVALRR